MHSILQSLAWAGIQPDEGPPPLTGAFGPYTQSERASLYNAHVQRLLDAGHAYRCFCPPERLEALRADQQRRQVCEAMNHLPFLRQRLLGRSHAHRCYLVDHSSTIDHSSMITAAPQVAVQYDGHCRDLDAAEGATRAAAGVPHVVRLRVPRDGGSTVVRDSIRGRVVFQHSSVDDQVLLKSDGLPTYHLACVVDDRAMRITHVVRGEEWLSSTVKHALLYKAFGWPQPVWTHLPLLLNAKQQKLSKRHDDVSVEHFIAAQYLPEALVNFVAFLGWNPGGEREVYSIDELAAEFNVARCQKSNAVVNIVKLRR